jgi:N-acetylglucosamine kinase-like BadF-type ATPase
MARCLFARMGGTDWASTRQFIYGRERGEVGRLALAVAEAADLGDAEAASLLRRAGVEIGRLGAVLHRRFGPRPVVASGRVLLLHPLVGQGVRAGLPEECPLELKQIEPSLAAAHRARELWSAE